MSIETRLYGRNFSHIEYNACVSIKNTPQNIEMLRSNRSGHCQLEIDIPTGYRCEERYLKTLLGVVRNLGDAENIEGAVNFLFEFVDLDPICLKFTIERCVK